MAATFIAFLNIFQPRRFKNVEICVLLHTISIKKISMKITNIKINKLFDLFDYDIPFDNEENLRILTGPNGFGKTMILNIIYNLFNQRFLFFQKLIFETITIHLDNSIRVEIIKKNETERSKVDFYFYKNDRRLESFSSKDDIFKQLENIIPYLKRLDTGQWFDRRNDVFLSMDEIEEYVENYYPEWEFIGEHPFKRKNQKNIHLLENLKVHLIKEQRLFKKVKSGKRLSGNSEPNSSYMTDTIREYAKELRSIINDTLQNSLKISQELDSSFPKRLLSETGKLNESDYNHRFGVLIEQQKKLRRYGLSESEQEVPAFDDTNAKVLFVYLNDTEKKLGVFESLLARLELFTSILNERRFTFKSIKIDRERGFTFLTRQHKSLSLTDLSSGEQHEVVILYELIFRTEENTLVLIDEPEISLHITWQKEFINDLLRIIALKQVQVIIATHSPQIIHDRWDLTYNLETHIA
jgi:predicted ATP-binding protein involved in virulence